MLRTMHDKDLARMRSFPDLPDDALRPIRARTSVLFGDRDLVKPEHGIELTRLIPSARLLILPAVHGNSLGKLVMTQRPSPYPEPTAGLIEAFPDAP
jgi:hypothetical protein